jgi:hypothetical protein
MSGGNGDGRIYWIGGARRLRQVDDDYDNGGDDDHPFEQRPNVLLVECDTSSPDVWKASRGAGGDGAHRPIRWTAGYTSSTGQTGTATASWWSTPRRVQQPRRRSVDREEVESRGGSRLRSPTSLIASRRRLRDPHLVEVTAPGAPHR